MRYREVCIGGSKHGHRLTKTESEHVGKYGAIRFPVKQQINPFMLDTMEVPQISFETETYYKRFFHEHRGVPIHFFAHERLSDSAARDEMVDFLLYPLEAEE